MLHKLNDERRTGTVTLTATPTRTASPEIQEILDRIQAALPEISAEAKAGDTDRRLTDRSIEILRSAGALSASTPRRHGGAEATVREMLEVSTLLGTADAAAGWVAMLTNVCGWFAGLFSHQAQQDVFGDHPDAIVTGVLMPTSTSVRADGGYRITGKWYYNSGSWWSDWAVLGFPITDDAGEIVDQGLALVPANDYRVEDSWFISGMRGTASNTIVVEDVFVPEHRVLFPPQAIEGRYANETYQDEPVHRSAFIPVAAAVLVGPSLGAAETALQYVRGKAAVKGVSQTFFEKQSESTAVQLQVARAAQLIEVARLLTFDVADRIDRWGEDGYYPVVAERARVKANVGFIAESLQQAIDLLVAAHGSGSFADSNPLQRIWRDIHVGTSHAVVSPAIGYETYGKALLGDPTPITPMV